MSNGSIVQTQTMIHKSNWASVVSTNHKQKLHACPQIIYFYVRLTGKHDEPTWPSVDNSDTTTHPHRKKGKQTKN